MLIIIVCSPKSIQNSSQNPSKILPKSSQNRFGTLPEPFQNPPSKMNALKNRFFSIFFNFFQFFGGPGASQIIPKSRKIAKKTQKNRSKKNTCFSTPLFHDFSWFWPPKTKPKSSFFRYFFANADFVKIMVFPRENHYFSWFGLLKYDPKSMPKRARKKHRKKASQKSILATILAPKILPKTSEILPKSDVKRSLFRDAMEMARKSSQGSGAQSFGTVSLVFQRIRSALSVDRSFVALILNASF